MSNRSYRVAEDKDPLPRHTVERLLQGIESALITMEIDNPESALIEILKTHVISLRYKLKEYYDV